MAVGLLQCSYSRLVPGRGEGERKAKKKGGSCFSGVPDESPLHLGASGYFALDVLLSCLQPCPSVSAVSSLCSHPGTEGARGHDRRQLLAAPGRRRKAVRQGRRLEGELATLQAQ